MNQEAEAVHSREKFVLADGTTRIPFRSMREFTLRDARHARDLVKQYQLASSRSLKRPTDEEAARQVDRVIKKTVRFILPDMPEDILRALSGSQGSEILLWWSGRNQGRPGLSPTSPARQELARLNLFWGLGPRLLMALPDWLFNLLAETEVK